MNNIVTLKQLAEQGRKTASLIMAATISSKISQIRKENIKQAFIDFENIKYRREFVDIVNGVTYFDDSGACSTNATYFTFDNLNLPVVWIAGAGLENDNCEDIISQVKKYVKTLICVGKNTSQLHRACDDILKDKIIDCENLAEAVSVAFAITELGDNVLFSPACNVDENYRDFAERGDFYKKCVKSLKMK